MFKWGCELSKIMNRNINDICNKVSSWGRKRDPCFGLALECRNQLGLSRLAWTLPSHQTVKCQQPKDLWSGHPKWRWLSHPIVLYIVVFKRVTLNGLVELLVGIGFSTTPEVSIIFKIWVFYKARFERFEFFIRWPYAVFHKMQVVFYKKCAFYVFQIFMKDKQRFCQMWSPIQQNNEKIH